MGTNLETVVSMTLADLDERIKAARREGFEAFRTAVLEAYRSLEMLSRSAAWIKLEFAIKDLKPASAAGTGATELLHDINDRIMWMAEKYAEAGGSNGPEMREYREINARLGAVLARLARGDGRE